MSEVTEPFNRRIWQALEAHADGRTGSSFTIVEEIITTVRREAFSDVLNVVRTQTNDAVEKAREARADNNFTDRDFWDTYAKALVDAGEAIIEAES